MSRRELITAHLRVPLILCIAVTGCENRVAGPPAVREDLLLARAPIFSEWSSADRLESSLAPAHETFNTAYLDGCPQVSRDGKMFFMASTRPRFPGDTRVDIDIWVSTRESVDDPWGAPVNVGAPVNSLANDFCPTIDRDGHRFFFVSTRATWGAGSAPEDACGGADIYVSRRRSNVAFGDPVTPAFEEPRNLGCEPFGPNSPADEASPSPIPESGSGPLLYFSSTRVGGFSKAADGPTAGDADVYVSRARGRVYGPANLVPGVNSAADDAQPNIRQDGLEIFFYSTRAGGPPDIYSASRAKTSAAWSTPDDVAAVNSPAAETRPSISWDGTTLHFGSTRPGSEIGLNGLPSADIYRATRVRDHGSSF